jgi:hypothetical protein
MRGSRFADAKSISKRIMKMLAIFEGIGFPMLVTEVFVVMVVSKSEEVQSHATLSYLHECRPLFIFQIQ